MPHRPIAPIYILCLVVAGPRAAAQSSNDSATIPGGSLRRFVAEAAARLEDPGCAQILTDFRDPVGRPLADRLESTGLDASAYVFSVSFRTARGRSQCFTSRVLLLTSVGGHLVWACEPQYSRMALGDPEMAVAAVLHEALHTLGLGENPPSSAEITARVLTRCPRRPRLLTSR